MYCMLNPSTDTGSRGEARRTFNRSWPSTWEVKTSFNQWLSQFWVDACVSSGSVTFLVVQTHCVPNQSRFSVSVWIGFLAYNPAREYCQELVRGSFTRASGDLVGQHMSGRDRLLACCVHPPKLAEMNSRPLVNSPIGFRPPLVAPGHHSHINSACE